MISLREFIVLSFIIWIILFYILRKLYAENRPIPIIVNQILFIVLTLFFVGGYGVIFKGGDLIEDLHLIRRGRKRSGLYF